MQASAELRICAALKHFMAGDYPTMAHDMGQARAMLDAREPQSRRAVDVLLRAMDLVLARVEGDMEAIVEAATDLLASVPDATTPVLPAAAEYEAAALTNRGHALLWLTRTDEAERDLRAGRAVAEDAGLELTLVNALGSLALLELDRSGPRAASLIAHEALAIAEPRGWTGLLQTAIVYLTLAAVHLERDDVAEAQRLLGLGLAAQRNDSERVALGALNAIQARVLVAGGHHRQARSVIDDSTKILDGWAAPPLFCRWLAITEAELHLATGDPRAALGVVERSGAADVGPLRTVAARAHVALGELLAAEALLTHTRRAGNAVTAVEAWLLTALVADHVGDETRAMTALERALTIAQPEEIRRPFIAFDGSRVQAMLRQRPPVSSMLEPVVSDLFARLAATPALTQPVVPLTPREKDVLVHLARMQTNEEIGVDLFVSINTVKVHTISVYRKLGVANRREAVLRARDLGLL